MWRGIELILKGRDPREAWLFTQRICGVCTTVHAIASVRAVENALELEIPVNAQYIRNLIVTAHALHDHIVHFYHLSRARLGRRDLGAQGRPGQGRRAGARRSRRGRATRRKEIEAVKDKLAGFVAGGQLGIFTNGYWGHPAMKLSPEVNLLAVAHYLQALDYQRKANQVVAILGGKTPNIQNLAVGGVANAINLDNPATLNMDKLYMVKDLLEEVKTFVQQVYFADVCAIGGMYPEWLRLRRGRHQLPGGAGPAASTPKGTQFDLPGGTIFGGDIGERQGHHLASTTRTSATTWRSRSRTPGTTANWQKHPYEEETVPKYTEFDAAQEVLAGSKAPRFQGKPMQVGPLAQVLVGVRAAATSRPSAGR